MSEADLNLKLSNLYILFESYDRIIQNNKIQDLENGVLNECDKFLQEKNKIYEILINIKKDFDLYISEIKNLKNIKRKKMEDLVRENIKRKYKPIVLPADKDPEYYHKLLNKPKYEEL